MAGRGATVEEHTETLKKLPLWDMQRLFKKAAKLGVGIELNQEDIIFHRRKRRSAFIAFPNRQGM